MNGIAAAPKWANHEVVSFLRQRRTQVTFNEALNFCDFRCGVTAVLYFEVTNNETTSEQAKLLLRIDDAKIRQKGNPVVVVARVVVEEPKLELLTWLNLECGVSKRCSLLLAWSVDDVAQSLSTFAASSVVSLEYSTRPKPRLNDAPLPIVIDALTQTPQLITRNDVVRIANRKSCLADVLLSEPSDFDGILGLGTRKVAKLQQLFRVPFSSSFQSVSDLVPSKGTDASSTIADCVRCHMADQANQGSTSASLASPSGDHPARQRMLDALQRRQVEEDEEDE